MQDNNNSYRFVGEQILTENQKMITFRELGIEQDAIDDVYHPSISFEQVVLGVDSTANWLFGYIIIFLMYIFVLVSGQSIAGSVANEKTSKAVEVLLVSTKTSNLIIGKVLGSVVASFIQIGIIAISGIITYQMNKEFWSIFSLIGNLSTNSLGLMILLALLGYLMYSFLLGASGAMVNDMREIGTATGYVQIVIIVAFLVSMWDVSYTISVILSIFPLTSPFVMVGRLCHESVPMWQLALSIFTLVMTIPLTVFVSVRIYSNSILATVPKLSLKNIYRLARGPKSA